MVFSKKIRVRLLAKCVAHVVSADNRDAHIMPFNESIWPPLGSVPATTSEGVAPKFPQDLGEHNVMSCTYWSSKDAWEFISAEGKPEVVRTRPRLCASNGHTCVAAALQDQGVVMQPDFLIHDLLREGTLKQLLDEYQTVEPVIHAACTSWRQLPLTLRSVIDFLVEAFEKPVWVVTENRARNHNRIVRNLI